LIDEDDEVVSFPNPSVIEEIAEEVSQREPVVITPGDALDLHAFSPKEVGSLLDEFIDLSQKAEIKLVKIIHGKGTGALRRRVHSLLARDARVVTFYHAPRKSGDWGATLVELKSRQEGESDEPSG
jgi:DNA-nicking Smr family endonuclease